MTVSPDSQPESGPADPREILGILGGSWGWALGFALATLVPGILVLVWPDETLHVLAVVLGLYLLVTGAFHVVTAFSRGGPERGSGLLRALVGLAAFLAGVLVLRNPLQTISALALILGVYWLLSGLLTAVIAIADRGLPHRGLTVAMGGLAVIAGIVVLSYPTESAVALARLLGLWLVLLGVVEVAVAFAIRAQTRQNAARSAVGPERG